MLTKCLFMVLHDTLFCTWVNTTRPAIDGGCGWVVVAGGWWWRWVMVVAAVVVDTMQHTATHERFCHLNRARRVRQIPVLACMHACMRACCTCIEDILHVLQRRVVAQRDVALQKHRRGVVATRDPSQILPVHNARMRMAK
jgi:hypothetical protein